MVATPGYQFFLPWLSIVDAVESYGLPLVVAGIWSLAAVYRAVWRRDRPSRGVGSVWWPLPFLLWALVSTLHNINAFEVLVENYTAALFLSVLLETQTAAISLVLLLFVLAPGLAGVRRLEADWPNTLAVVSVVGSLAAVALGYFISFVVTSLPLLEAMWERGDAL